MAGGTIATQYSPLNIPLGSPIFQSVTEPPRVNFQMPFASKNAPTFKIGERTENKELNILNVFSKVRILGNLVFFLVELFDRIAIFEF